MTGRIGRGFLLLAGMTHSDGDAQIDWMAEKISGLRLFADSEDKMNLALADVGGEVLVVSQFTLYANAEKGLRPSFTGAAPPERAELLVARFTVRLASHGMAVKTGVFRADMRVSIVNDGPVTIVLER